MNPTDLQQLLGAPLWLVAVASVWTLIWKGFALWKSAKKNSPIWFVVLLVVNTMGILEILYIFLFSKIDLPSVPAPQTQSKPKKARKKRK